jgi:hypothetical protein
VRTALAIGGLAALGTFLVAHWLPVSVARLGSLDPHIVTDIQPPAVELDGSTGPIVVTLEYRVPGENAAAFAAEINELGRIRQRDGARAWSVSQDIDDPLLWVERFESPTWSDYLRRHTRPTLADQAVRQRIAQLIEGERGVVRRFVGRPAGAEPLGDRTSRPEPVDHTPGHS